MLKKMLFVGLIVLASFVTYANDEVSLAIPKSVWLSYAPLDFTPTNVTWLAFIRHFESVLKERVSEDAVICMDVKVVQKMIGEELERAKSAKAAADDSGPPRGLNVRSRSYAELFHLFCCVTGSIWRIDGNAILVVTVEDPGCERPKMP